MLFAWHNHAHPRSSQAAAAVVALAPATDQEMPASAEDACQICFALSHHGAIPVDSFAAAAPDHLPAPTARATAVARPLPSYLLFRSRARRRVQFHPAEQLPRTNRSAATQKGTQ
jgi:hypothetical protein